MIFQYPDNYFFPVENDEQDDAERMNFIFRQLDEEEIHSVDSGYGQIMKDMDEEYAERHVSKLKIG